MKTIKRITPASLAKMLGLLYGFFGLIAGLVFLIIALVALSSGEPGGWFAVIGAILIPLVYGVIGYVCGYIAALLYNLAAKRVGGISLELEDVPGA